MKFRLFTATCILGVFLSANAQELTRPDVPQNLKAPESEKLVLQAHASGFQVYTCQLTPDGKPAWQLKAPEAKLFDQQGKEIGTHFAGPTWKHIDGSQVSGKLVTKADSPEPNSVPWLLLTATAHSGKGVLSEVTTIQRIHTNGGLAPAASNCDSSHQGAESKSAYVADYYFYAPAK